MGSRHPPAPLHAATEARCAVERLLPLRGKQGQRGHDVPRVSVRGGRAGVVARIRTIKPQFWESESLAELPRDARLMFIGMWNHADDEGRMRGRPALVRSNVFPYEEDITIPMVEHWLSELARVGSIRSYTVHGKPYIDIPEWSKHQVINRPQPSALPSYEDRDEPPSQAKTVPVTEQSVSHHGAINGGMEEEGNGMEEEGIEPLSRSQPEIEAVWNAYRSYHPRANLTADRRKLIQRRLRDHTVGSLVAAVHGNHADPHCNGQNDRGTEYHALKLILRDADQIERYAGITTNGIHPTSAAGQTLQLAQQARLEGIHRAAI